MIIQGREGLKKKLILPPKKKKERRKTIDVGRERKPNFKINLAFTSSTLQLQGVWSSPSDFLKCNMSKINFGALKGDVSPLFF